MAAPNPNPIPIHTVPNGLIMTNPKNASTTMLHTLPVMVRNYKNMRSIWTTSLVMMTNGSDVSNGHANIHNGSKRPTSSEKQIVQSPA